MEVDACLNKYGSAEQLAHKKFWSVHGLRHRKNLRNTRVAMLLHAPQHFKVAFGKVPSNENIQIKHSYKNVCMNVAVVHTSQKFTLKHS